MVDHKIILRGLNTLFLEPTIVKRTDQDFIAAVLDELKDEYRELEEGEIRQTSVSDSSVNDGDKPYPLTLFQPVHRTFYLALVEAVCDLPGQPRVDPQRIEGSGLVVRRANWKYKKAEDGTRGWSKPSDQEGWLSQDNSIRGWLAFADKDAQDLDPDPSYRRPTLSVGNSHIDSILARNDDSPYVESTVPLFVAPPEVCEATGKTILYGVIPVTDNESSEADPSLTEDWDTGLSHMIPDYLKKGPATTMPTLGGSSGRTLNKDDIKEPALADFLNSLRLFTRGLSLFDDDTAAEGLLAALAKIELPSDSSTSHGDKFFEKAYSVLVLGEGGSITLPEKWPAIGKALAGKIEKGARSCLQKRVIQYASNQNRYSGTGDTYLVRAFVRVRRDDVCPPQTFWSVASGGFRIAPWYESGDVPPPTVELPDAFDGNFLKKAKPNVAFKMPESLFNTINSIDPEKLMEGDDSSQKTPTWGVQWICGFNIPFITICAFIVLNIFLQLLNIIFWWLPFIKICIPIPLPKKD